MEQAFQAVAKNAMAQETDADLINDFPDPIKLKDDQTKPADGCAC